MFKNPITITISNFLNAIGIEVAASNFDDETVLPGIKIDNGRLLVDESRLLYPGDLLHEAGHIAVKPSDERKTVHINCRNDPAEEMMSIAWSYAALVHLNIPPDIVFHQWGYKGQAQQLIHGFQNGYYIGLPMLQWLGMAADHQRAPSLGVEPFPKMIKWLRD